MFCIYGHCKYLIEKRCFYRSSHCILKVSDCLYLLPFYLFRTQSLRRSKSDIKRLAPKFAVTALGGWGCSRGNPRCSHGGGRVGDSRWDNAILHRGGGRGRRSGSLSPALVTKTDGALQRKERVKLACLIFSVFSVDVTHNTHGGVCGSPAVSDRSFSAVRLWQVATGWPKTSPWIQAYCAWCWAPAGENKTLWSMCGFKQQDVSTNLINWLKHRPVD